ncbi:MAG: ATP-grasp domain-containing protein [Lysobacteraceae bacterium]|nr:MAG: ATP-grasp domain-containing protein [Xanthomonadaceae bacterium]
MNVRRMNILILGTNRGGHQRLIERGHRVVFLSKASTAVRDDVKAGYSDLLLLADDADDALYLRIAEALHAQHRFDVVHSFHDGYQVLAATVAAKLGVRCLIDAGAVRTTIDKAKTREAARANGLSAVDAVVVSDFEALSAHCARKNGALIVKPVDGTASRGVVLVRNRSEIDALAAAEFPMLVEDFIEGDEFSVEAFSVDGEHHILAITEKFKHPDTFVEIGHLVPARLTQAQADAAASYVADVLDVVGMRNGPSHTEIMLAGDRIELIETHSRTGGDEIPHLVRLATDIDVHTLDAVHLEGGDPRAVLQASLGIVQGARRYAAIRYLAADPRKTGVLGAINGVEDARAMPGIVECVVEKHPGETVRALTNSFDRLAYAIAVGDDGDAALSTAQMAVSALRVDTRASAP